MVSTNVRLTRPLGEGAMGCVWVAEHLTLRTQVAVKFISSHLAASDPEILARFEQEAATAAQIKSPHVVQTFDQGVMADGTPYIVMELLDGETLQERLDRSGRLSLALAAQVITQMARVLSRAHALGIVHRDIKPDNIFVTPTEDGIFCKVLDFGIAKQTQLPKMGGLTNPGVMVGTPEYMSPEQVMSAKDVDFRADLWALAVTMYHAITGRLPFTAEALGTLCIKLLDGRFQPPSELRDDLNAGFDSWFLKAMAHDPDDRFDGARNMARAFAKLVAEVDGSVVDEISVDGVSAIAAIGTAGGLHSAATTHATDRGAAATAHDRDGPGTLTGSASNRHHNRPTRPGWRVAAMLAAATLALGAGASLALMSSSTADSSEAAATQSPAANAVSAGPGSDDHTAAEPPAGQSAEPAATNSASDSPAASATASSDASATTPAVEPSSRPPAAGVSKPAATARPQNWPRSSGSGKPRRRDHGF